MNIATAGPRSLWLRQTLLAIPLLLLVVVVALITALVIVDEPTTPPVPRAEVGDVLVTERPVAEELPHSVDAYLPWARIKVAASEPQDALRNLNSATHPLVRAPEDGSFVLVRVRVQEWIPYAAVGSAHDADATLVLRADGTDYPVMAREDEPLVPSAAPSARAERWVAVAGHPERIELLLTVDGETQVVNASRGTVDLGRAATLAQVPTDKQLDAFERVPCRPFRHTGKTRLRVRHPQYDRCALSLAVRLPYVEGLGWARAGREFLVLLVEAPYDFEVSTATERDWHATYHLSTRLDGRGNIGRGAPPLLPGTIYATDSVQLVHDVATGEPTGDLRILAHVKARLHDPLVDEHTTGTFAVTIAGRELP